jgi:S-adenosylmethionine-diacylglycerol 3-amino-3-carboxypropyl transferase
VRGAGNPSAEIDGGRSPGWCPALESAELGYAPAMKRALNSFIERAYFRGLVFNQSWEDPVLDREALRIAPDRDVVVSITSGGCNSLNLLALRPRSLVCVDANPAQTYLLQLKLAGIAHLDHGDFFTLFGSSTTNTAAVAIYRTALRQRLPDDAQRYWDRNLNLLRRGLLSRGKLGFFLRSLRRYLQWRIGERRLLRFFQLNNLDEQRDFYYSEIHWRLWSAPALRILGSRPVLAFAGMHPRQYDLIESWGGIDDYLRNRIEYVLTTVPIRDNYFLAQAALGRYLDNETVPPYLLEQNFAALKETVERVTVVTGRLTDYLASRPESSIDKFNLLDIFDWMDRQTFLATLRAVIRAGTDQGRFIYRSTIGSLPIPAELQSGVVGEEELARRLFAQDRSATYSSFYVYRVNKPALAQTTLTRPLP